MRVITAFILAAARGAVAAPEAAAQTTARGMYTTLQSREQTTRRALDAGKPSASSGATCSASSSATRAWSRGSPATATPTTRCGRRRFWRPTPSRATAWTSIASTPVRLLRRLAKEYPASPLIKRADPALKRLRGRGARGASAATGGRRCAGCRLPRRCPRRLPPSSS